jgi:DNA-binding NtrC family response regulator
VLLVDDDTEVLHCLARMLQKQPYQLYTARSGEEAVSLLMRCGVDVVVADERMPGMSGTDLFAWVAGNRPEIVRILLSGYADTATLARAINEGGVSNFLSKPCNEAHLAVLICKALEHKDLLARHELLLEANTRQAREQERLVQGTELLVQVLSRDVRRPLSAVAQACQALVERHTDCLDSKAGSLIQGVLEAVTDMHCMLEDLLAEQHGQLSPAAKRPVRCCAL